MTLNSRKLIPVIGEENYNELAELSKEKVAILLEEVKKVRPDATFEELISAVKRATEFSMMASDDQLFYAQVGDLVIQLNLDAAKEVLLKPAA